tara:strand:+ start:387 stop:737 length:351 start_codon:yes stop_codon:yes gene_type:complete
MNIKPIITLIANNTPINVATPFPPLNFNQIGNICPKIINKPNMEIKRKSFDWKIYGKKNNGKKPLEMSNNKTIRAKTLFPVLKTFVAPILPDPIFLISPNPNNLVKIKAKGIDPIK